MIICARKGCEVPFDKKTHNNKYCSDECCRLATNVRLKVNYYHDKDRKSGKTRMCETCNVTKLSRYNETLVCASCRAKKEIAANNSALNMLINASLAV